MEDKKLLDEGPAWFPCRSSIKFFLECTKRESKTERNPRYNDQEKTSGYEKDSSSCPLMERARTFEKLVSKKYQHHNLCARRMVIFHLLLMEVSTEIKSH